MAFPASAAGVRGKITSIDSGSISGWAWNPDNTNDVQNVEIHIFQAGKAEPIQYLHVTADKYREDLVADLKDGWHGFRAEVNWSQFNCSDFKVKAYVVKDGSYYLLGDAVSYSRTSGSSSKAPASSVKPAAQPAAQVTMVQPPSSAPTGASPQLVPISNTETLWASFPSAAIAAVTPAEAAQALPTPASLPKQTTPSPPIYPSFPWAARSG